MPSKTTHDLLCFIISWAAIAPAYATSDATYSNVAVNEEALLQQYPHAQIIHVSPEEYPRLAARLQRQGYSPEPMHLAQNETPSPTTSTIKNTPHKHSLHCTDEASPQSHSDASLQVMIDFSDNMRHHGSGDGAAILFIIVGTIVVIAWSLYIFKYLYDVSKGFQPCGRWSEIMLTSSYISSTTHQHAEFSGLRYSMGFRNGSTDVGIGLELGQADILLTEIGALQLHGHYWLIGPMLRWPLTSGSNPHYILVTFMAGTTENSETGFIAKSSLGIRFGIGTHWNLGFDWGALNINLNENQGTITQLSQYYSFYGFNMGYRF